MGLREIRLPRSCAAHGFTVPRTAFRDDSRTRPARAGAAAGDRQLLLAQPAGKPDDHPRHQLHACAAGTGETRARGGAMAGIAPRGGAGMKICHVITGLNAGGAEIALCRLLESLPAPAYGPDAAGLVSFA